VDVRIIAATNTPASELQKGGDFREDLFYRLHVVPITIPPLRERRSDIPVLAIHFLQKLRGRTNACVSQLSEEALERLMEYDWPGNVRELENVMERALVLSEGDLLQEDDLPFLPTEQGPDTTLIDASFPKEGVDLNQAVEGIEERLLRKALEQAKGVKAEAARLLGIKPSALYYKLEKYGIEG
jgi:two-component system response regulator HydG